MAPRNYVNNRRFYEVMKEYHAQVKEAKATGAPKPQVPNYVGECLYLIATRLSNKPKYYMYTFKAEMVSEAVLNCLEYIDNFNPDKSDNPFAYFTQTIKNAFLRRIERESKIRYHHYKMKLGHMSLAEMKKAEHMINFVKNYEEYEKTRAAKAKKATKMVANSIATFFSSNNIVTRKDKV